ncbi:unnamed protein product [Agarophyton chilense]
MAEVQPDVPNAPISTAKPGHHSHFSAAQLAMTREIAAAKAHKPAYCETRKRLELAASRISANPLFPTPVSCKTFRDRSKRLPETYDAADNQNQRLFDVGGGQMGELADPFMSIKEARDDALAEKSAARLVN